MFLIVNDLPVYVILQQGFPNSGLGVNEKLIVHKIKYSNIQNFKFKIKNKIEINVFKIKHLVEGIERHFISLPACYVTIN